MNNCGDFTKKGFLILNIICGALLYYNYDAFVMRSIEGMSMSDSYWILAALMVVFLLWSAVFHEEKHCTLEMLAYNIYAPIGIYTCVTYFSLNPPLFVILGILFGGLILLYVVLFWRNAVRKGMKMVKKSLLRFFAAARLLVMCGTFGLVIGLSLNSIFSSTPLRSQTIAVEETQTETVFAMSDADTIIRQNAELLCRLEYDIWEILTASERLEILQAVADVECAELGIPHKLIVCSSITSDEDLMGYYNDTLRRITISMDHLMEDDMWEVIDTVCHESRHAYQHRLVELYERTDEDMKSLEMFDVIRTYADEMEHYISGDEDPDAYYEQRIEEDARDYGDYRSDWYFFAVLSGEFEDALSEEVPSKDLHIKKGKPAGFPFLSQ